MEYTVYVRPAITVSAKARAFEVIVAPGEPGVGALVVNHLIDRTIATPARSAYITKHSTPEGARVRADYGEQAISKEEVAAQVGAFLTGLGHQVEMGR